MCNYVCTETAVHTYPRTNVARRDVIIVKLFEYVYVTRLPVPFRVVEIPGETKSLFARRLGYGINYSCLFVVMS